MNKKEKMTIVLITIILSFFACGCTEEATESPVGSETMEITDMLGRTVTVPKNVTRVVTSAPPTTMLLYMLAPEKQSAWNFMPKHDPIFIPKEYLELPIIGNWGSYETFIENDPDIVFEGFTTAGSNNETVKLRQEKLGSIPVVAIDENLIYTERSVPATLFMGKLLGKEEQAQKLVNFNQRVLGDIKAKAASIPPEKRVRVYYAGGANGLTTDPPNSIHSQTIDLCGGINIADCKLNMGAGTPVSIEQVVQWKPEVIITMNPEFYAKVYSDPLWAEISAVKQKRVYLAPNNPFSWIDRPPGPHLVLGTAWAAKKIYPEVYEDIDIEALTKEFYADFLHYPLSDDELKTLLK